MIQSPLLGYSAFSQLLQRCAPSTPMTSPPGALGSALGGPRLPPQAAPPPGVPQFLTSSLLQHLQLPQLQQHQHLACPSPPSPGSLSSVSPSPSSSPPTSLGALSGLGLASGHGVKSFTIDAILGLSAASSTPRRDGRFLHQHYGMQEPVSEPSSPTDLSLGGGPRPPQQLSRAGLDQVKKQGGGGKCKRVRTIFTADQLERLEAEFERQQYMVGPERLYLAHALNLTEAQVKVWFQNRRIKWRKQHLEVEQQRLAAIKQHPQQQQQPAHLPHPQLEQDDDEHSEDSVMSEDRTCYFPSMVMPNGLASAPDDRGHRDGLVGVLAARAPPEHDMQAPAAPPAPSEDRDDGDTDLGPLEHRAVQ